MPPLSADTHLPGRTSALPIVEEMAVKMNWKDSSDLLQANLNELFEDYEISSRVDLRTEPELLEQVCEELVAHERRTEGYVQEDRYPVIVEVTQKYVLWLEGTSAEDVAQRLSDDSEWYEEIKDVEPVDHSFTAEAPEAWDRYLVYPSKLGPAQGCCVCEMSQPWDGHLSTWVYHKPECPVGIERNAERDREYEAWKADAAAKRAAR